MSQCSHVLKHCRMLSHFSQPETTSQKSNTRVNTATTASKTRMKLSVIKILFTSGSSPGPAPISIANMTVPSILHLKFNHPITTPPNNRLHLQASLWLSTHAATVVSSFQTILVQIGTLVLHILPINTSSASAISRRNSSVRITSVSISSTATAARVGSGPTCSNKHA